MKTQIILILFISILGCKSQDNDTCKNAICTQIFVSVSANISDTTNKTLEGIHTKTVIVKSGLVIHTQTATPNSNTFNIVDDSHIKLLGYNSETQLILQVFKANNLVKTVPYTIKTDCCHIEKIAGLEEISLN